MPHSQLIQDPAMVSLISRPKLHSVECDQEEDGWWRRSWRRHRERYGNNVDEYSCRALRASRWLLLLGTRMKSSEPLSDLTLVQWLWVPLDRPHVAQVCRQFLVMKALMPLTGPPIP